MISIQFVFNTEVFENPNAGGTNFVSDTYNWFAGSVDTSSHDPDRISSEAVH